MPEELARRCAAATGPDRWHERDEPERVDNQVRRGPETRLGEVADRIVAAEATSST
jgi:hypothetical protein